MSAEHRRNAVSSKQSVHHDTHQFTVNPLIVFVVLSICHTLAALYAPIQDCDEVFNYWEPTHYLTHGHGLQTWEYAPRFAIRSWSYAGLHALIIGSWQRILPGLSKPRAFVAVRITLGAVCAGCETRFFISISRTLNERVAILFVIIAASAPGLYHASVAYLPSSFAMYAAMLGASAFMDWREGLHTAQGILWFGLGACLGWPFEVALSAPYFLEEVVLAWLSDNEGRRQFIRRTAYGIGLALLLLGVQVAIDAAFYRKLTIVPLNIILYNVFSSKGPDLYGTEPWHFYLRNLALNFHVWLLLALSAMPILLFQLLTVKARTRRYRAVVFLAPFYLWLAIFTSQPHKEERFMYPAYPFLILNAAYTLHVIISILGNSSPGSVVARIPVMLRLLLILLFLFFTILLSALRIAGTWTAFSAPLHICDPLHSLQTGGNVCLGKEWYRFPSHYLLPEGFFAKFIRSEFHGLLPGEFANAKNTTGLYSGTWMEPTGMNDENLEDDSKYVIIESCDFLIDSHLPSTAATSLEPDYVNDERHWKQLECLPFLDAASTGILARLIYIPDHQLMPKTLQRVWGEYCLLQRQSDS